MTIVLSELCLDNFACAQTDALHMGDLLGAEEAGSEADTGLFAKGTAGTETEAHFMRFASWAERSL